MTEVRQVADRQRVDLVPTEEWEPGLEAFVQRALLSEDEPLNFYKAMVYHPKLLEKWTVFAARVLGKGILDKRHRELVVLRTVWNTGATYEWVHHAEIGAENGLAPDEIEAIKAGPSAEGWSDVERALLSAADELHNDDVIGDATFATLRDHFDEAHVLEVIMLVGNYHLVSYYVRSFGVQLEDHMLSPGA